LQVVNQIAAPDRRAEVISSYFVCVFSGNALPVVGIGVITTIAGATLASLIFAVMIMAFAFLTLAFAIKYANPDQARGLRVLNAARGLEQETPRTLQREM
jgi:hypothetical protein